MNTFSFAVIVGAGLSGKAAAKLLNHKGVRVRMLEKDPARITPDFAQWAKYANVEIICGPHTPEYFAGADAIIPSPGAAISSLHDLLPEKNPPEIIAETELAFRELEGEKVIGITGTSGKTTTTSLCAAMLKEYGLKVFTGGNIGTPLSEYILSRNAGASKADAVVLELSSFQLQTCSTLRPHVGILLNISENHLDYHKDMQEYTDAKMRLFAKQTADDLAILQQGMDKLADSYKLAARRIYYTPCERFQKMQLFGAHNQANAEAAWLACKELKISFDAASRAVAKFPPIEHRIEKVDERHGILFINDSKATTIEAMRVALSAFNRPILLLAGGKFKGGNLPSLRPLIKEKVRHLALFGANRQVFEEAWSDIVPVSYDTTLEQALLRLAGPHGLARQGDIVLLSPATSSFDQYPNYMERGNDFKRIVKEILPA